MTALLLWLTVSIADPGLLLVDDFSDGDRNRLGGLRDTYQRKPSAARSERGRDGDVYFWRIRARRDAAGGFCGAWMHLFDRRLDPDRQTFVNGRWLGRLAFRVRGQRGGERFSVRFADHGWVLREDSVLAGSIESFLPHGVTTNWQTVQVPLPDAGLDPSQLAGLTFDFPEPGEFVIDIADVRLVAHANTAPPLSDSLASVPRLPAVVTSPRTKPAALWLWESEDILRQPSAWPELFRFCRQHGINQVWTQLLYDVRRTNGTDTPDIAIRQPDVWRQFLRAAHAAEIAVHALDGLPEFSLQGQHAIPLGVVSAVIAFQRDRPPADGFDGVHFDNEPYLLLGWRDPQRREVILGEYLALNERCQRLVRQQSTMRYGVDIPFWWQDRDEETGEPNGVVTYRGRRQAASYHCLDLLDNVGVMNYRDRADGADGLIAHGRDLLEYGERTGGATVYMGVETFAPPPAPVWFLVGRPRTEMRAALRRADCELARLSRLEDLRLQTFDDGERLHFGVELPPNERVDRPSERVARVLRRLARDLGFGDAASESPAREHALRQLARDEEWSEATPTDFVDDKSKRRWAGFVAHNRMLSKITFGDDRHADFLRETAAAEAFFGRHRRYGGLAIHFYTPFRKLTTSETP